MTAPLITTSDGKKMGKSASGAVWLNADLLSPCVRQLDSFLALQNETNEPTNRTNTYFLCSLPTLLSQSSFYIFFFLSFSSKHVKSSYSFSFSFCGGFCFFASYAFITRASSSFFAFQLIVLISSNTFSSFSTFLFFILHIRYDYWQFWRNTADADVGRFLKLFTELSLEKIEELASLKGQVMKEYMNQSINQSINQSVKDVWKDGWSFSSRWN